MTRNFQMAWLALLAICAMVTWAHGETIVDSVKSVPWTVADSARLDALLKNKSEVQEFVNALVGDPDIPLNVGEYEWVDFNGDGNLELVVTVDASGRAFYTGVFVFSENHGQIVHSEVSTDGANFTDLAKGIVDLNSDGKKELVVPRLVGEYAGATPVPEFMDIYIYTNEGLKQSDKEFSDYYLNIRVPELTREIGELNSRRMEGDSTAGEKRDALQAEIAAIDKMFTP